MSEGRREPDRTACDAHEALLMGVVTGDLDPADEAAAPLLACEICRRRLARLRQVAGWLDTAGGEQRAILDDVRAGPASRGPRFGLWAIAAAAIVVVGLVVWNMWPEPDRRGPSDDQRLHDPREERVEPRGDVDAFDRFDWSPAALEPGERFRVEVFGRDGAATPDDRAFLVADDLLKSVWEPDTEQRAKLAEHRRIEWLVYRVTTGGERELVARELARRR